MRRKQHDRATETKDQGMHLFGQVVYEQEDSNEGRHHGSHSATWFCLKNLSSEVLVENNNKKKVEQQLIFGWISLPSWTCPQCQKEILWKCPYHYPKQQRMYQGGVILLLTRKIGCCGKQVPSGPASGYDSPLLHEYRLSTEKTIDSENPRLTPSTRD